MASTYTLISSNVLSSSAASVTFSAIPSTYTDLVLRMSLRTDNAAATSNLGLTINSQTTGVYSDTELRGSGSAATSGFDANLTYYLIGYADGSTATSNTFSSSEVYLPNYLVSQNHPIGAFTVQEDNATAARMTASAGLIRDTSAINSVTIYSKSGSSNFVSGSSFYLYGIKNS
jgi:hypothetical protein